MRNFVVAAAIVLTIASAAGWARSMVAISTLTMDGSTAIDVFALQADSKDLPTPVVQDLI